MAYFRNKSRTAAAETIEPEIPVDHLLPDEDGLRREPNVDQLQRETVAPAEPPEAPAESPQAEQQAKPQDSASEVLRSQIEAIKRSEAIQQQRQQMAVADQRRAEWLQANGLAQKHYSALGHIHHEALKAGFADLSDDYFRFMEQGLEALEPPVSPMEAPMPAERQQPAAPAAAPDTTPAPEFFRPPPVRMPAPKSVMVSAPVTRSIPSSDRERIETNPNSVKLSPAELEIARSSGISPVEYAKGKLRLEREKRDGMRQG